jgi:diguanylate cyclase (GGDEF)-like protein
MGLASGVMHLVLGAPELGQVQQAARVPQVLASLVASAVFNFGYLFLLMGRLIGQWRASARQDHLTGLPNRRATEDGLAVDWARHQRHMSGLSVALIDVDHFKSINDRHGHARGDEVLVFVARHLQSRIRVGETLGRWGGEEFLLSMPGSSLAAARIACDRLRESLRQAAEQTLGESLTVSIGVAQVRPGETAPQALVDRADRAMYRAKADGRDRVTVTE